MTRLEEKWSLARETVRNGRLSVVMPVYNLAPAIEKNLRETAALFEKHSLEAELVPVDDGSTDGTGEILSRLARSWPASCVSLKPVICEKNGGKGAALRAGFDASSGRYVMLLDGDLDIHPKQTPRFFEAMVKNRADIVVGSKRHPRSVVQYPWHRRFVSWVYFTLVRLFIGLPITDTQTGMKLFKREVLGDALGRMLVKTYAFDLELLAIAHQRGAKIAEAPVVIKFGNKFGALKASTVRAMAWDSLAVFYRLKLLKYYAKAEVPRRPDRDPLVSVVIACPKESWMLDECLKGLKDQTYGNFETIVLPDSLTGKVRPAEKRNIGIAMAKGEIVAFIDDDAYPDAHWLEYAVKYFGDPSIGALGGPGITPPDDPYLAKIGGRIYDSILVSGNYRYRYRAGGVRKDVDDYPSCNLFVRKSLLDSFGGYRTDFWPGEDTLLCKDILDAGARIVYDPWVIVNHHRRAVFAPHLRQLGRYAFHRGYFCKRFPSNSLHLSYFIPGAFVVYLLLWIPASCVSTVPGSAAHCALAAFLLPLPLYFLIVFLATFSLNPVTWLLTALGVFLSHVWYGVRFIQGLCAKKAPCEFIGKDHA
ncbi:MAG: glycosyltransferase [Kiritimatiellae bacterium]|nr:glycosyltransferase [Kiritimatiellia bacterium]